MCFKYTVRERKGPVDSSVTYEGFKRFTLDSEDLKEAMFMVTARVEDAEETWLVEDEQGFRALKRFYRDRDPGLQVFFVVSKPFAFYNNHSDTVIPLVWSPRKGVADGQ